MFGHTLPSVNFGTEGQIVPPGKIPVVCLEDGFHYRCATRGQKYEPWQDKSYTIYANKIIVTTPGDDAQLAAMVKMQVGEVAYQFVRWVDTPNQILERRCQEIQLKLAEETKHMSPEQFKEHVLQKIMASSGRTYFAKQQMPPHVVQMIDKINCNRTPGTEKARWRYDHLVGGFWGAKAPVFVADGPNKTVVMDNDDAIAMWAYSRILCGLAKQ